MKKKVAIIGAGISGLIFANLLKQDSKYDFTIYEKNSSLKLNEGYGVQLSVNSVFILNKIGFKNFKIGNTRMPIEIVHALAIIKMSCAKTNQKQKLLTPKIEIFLQNS